MIVESIAMSDKSLKEQKKERKEAYDNDSDTFMLFVGQEIGNWLKRKDIKHNDIAEKTGRTRGWVGQVCRGESGSMKAVRIICKAADIDVSFICAKAEAAMSVEQKLLRMQDL